MTQPVPPVVVGYDATPAGEAALERALEEAATSGGKLVVVTVAEMPLDVEGRSLLR